MVGREQWGARTALGAPTSICQYPHASSPCQLVPWRSPLPCLVEARQYVRCASLRLSLWGPHAGPKRWAHKTNLSVQLFYPNSPLTTTPLPLFPTYAVVGDVDPNTEIFGVTLSKAMSLDEGRTLLASQDIPTLLDLILCNLEYKGAFLTSLNASYLLNWAVANPWAANATKQFSRLCLFGISGISWPLDTPVSLLIVHILTH